MIALFKACVQAYPELWFVLMTVLLVMVVQLSIAVFDLEKQLKRSRAHSSELVRQIEAQQRFHQTRVGQLCDQLDQGKRNS